MPTHVVAMACFLQMFLTSSPFLHGTGSTPLLDKLSLSAFLPSSPSLVSSGTLTLRRASIFKCFIPAKAFKTNQKYFSCIPEKKHPDDEWIRLSPFRFPSTRRAFMKFSDPRSRAAWARVITTRKNWCRMQHCCL